MVEDKRLAMIKAEYYGELVYKYMLSSNETLNTFKYEMSLSNVELPLVNMACEYINGQETLIYKYKGMTPLSVIKDIEPLQTMRDILNALIELASYHIYIEDILIDEEMIFYKPSQKRIEFMMLPVRQIKLDSSQALKRLFVGLLKGSTGNYQIDLKSLSEIYETLYKDQINGAELVERLSVLVCDAKQSSREQIQSPINNTSHSRTEDKSQNYESTQLKKAIKKNTKQFEAKSPLRVSIGMNQKMLPFILSIPAGLIWLCPISFEAKLGIDLLCIAGGLLLFQKFNPVGHTKKECTTEASVEKKKKKLTEKTPVIVNQEQRKPQEVPSVVNNITGEVNFTKNSSPNHMKNDKTVFLSEENAMPKLRIEGNENRVYDMQTMQTIGRNDAVCQIVLNHMSVGRLHAEIHLNQGKLFIRDLNSVNGTFVNQVRLKPSEYTAVAQGDQVKFGEVKAYIC